MNIELSSDHDFRIIVRGTVGGYQGDIAVDDFGVTQGPCQRSDAKTCDFESDMCAYTQVSIM